MNTSEKIVAYLVKHLNEPICDECLHVRLKAASSITRMVERMNPEAVRREVAMCTACESTKITTTAFRLPTTDEKRAAIARQQRNFPGPNRG